MTLGQRIAQKRKELGLSQEALGESLGLSRQAIYKWEADAATPEIDKLIALSKRFGVSVGWLLGVEDEAQQPQPDGELTEAQLAMVEEIVARYLVAQPRPAKRKKGPWVLLVLAVVIVGTNLFNRLEQLNDQYNNLQSAISDINNDVNNQIHGISGRVEEILKAQNALTAEYGTELVSADLAANTVTFSMRAVPKTFTDGMTAVFCIESGDASVEEAAVLTGGQAFTGTATVELTDSISLSVVFIGADGTRQTQLLDTYEGLFSASFPELDVNAMYLISKDVVDGSLDLRGEFVTTRESGAAKQFEGSPVPAVAEVRLGVFRNQRLLGWATACDQPSNFHGDYTGQQFYRLPDITARHLTESDKLHIAALVTDSYGRQFMASDIPFVVETDTDRDHPYLTYPSDGRVDRDPDHWIFA